MTEKKQPKFKEEDIERREWRFGTHLPSVPGYPDVHMVKELVTLKDKSQHSNLRSIVNYKRPVWSTKKIYRTYVDKKEYEKLSKLDMHMVTQSDMRNKIALLTDKATSNAHLSELLTSPYIFGGDIPSTTIINHELYRKPNQGLVTTPYKYAAFDTETDVVNGTETIIISSMTMLPYVHLVIREDWLAYNGLDPTEDILGALHKFIDPVMTKFYEHVDSGKRPMTSLYPQELRELKFSFEIVPSEIEIVAKSFEWFHEKSPDWMGIWNIDFDAQKIMAACKNADVDPTSVLCDPRIPHDLRVARYKKVNELKISAGKAAKPISPHDQWNLMHLTASFFMVDAMSTYRLLRLGEQEERSYSLDAILEKEFGEALSKLKYGPTEMYVKDRWHIEMQSRHKLPYIAYAAMDTISMCLLDRKVRDLSHNLPSLAGITDFTQCNSQPKRLRDSFYVFAKEEHNCIIGSVGYSREYKKKEPEPEFDYDEVVEEKFGGDDEDDFNEENAQVLDRRNWVITLPSHQSAPGLCLIEDNPKAKTGIRTHVYDSDAVSSYPSCTEVSNASKITTRKEVSSVEGIPEKTMRMTNINLLSGPVNALEYANTMFKTPTLLEILDLYDAENPRA